MSATRVKLRFQVGARTLASVSRRLVRVPVSLAMAIEGAAPVLPPLPAEADGYLVTSLPEDHVLTIEGRGQLAFVRQRYTRYFVDLRAGEAAWRAGLSGQTRSTLRRKARKLAEADGGTLDVRAYRTADEIALFHPLARRVSATTYQERLLDAGLPADPASLIAAAAEDRARAWLLLLAGEPIAYLCCMADGDTLRYDFVGHDPAHAGLSPGTVLMDAAMGTLFADRFRWFDFTEGEGQHKRGLASAGVACRDLLLLRPTIANRATIAAIGAFDAGMARAKRWTRAPALKRLARIIRR